MDYRIMDITCGDLVGGWFESREEAEDWIADQDEDFKYEVFES